MTLTPPLTVMVSPPWLPMKFSMPVSVSVPVSTLVEDVVGDDRPGRGRRQIVGVDAGTAVVGVVAVADGGDEPVVVGAAVQRVVADAAGQDVVAGAPLSVSLPASPFSVSRRHCR